MKRIFTLLWLTIAALSFKATAQPGTTCNAEFSVQYLSNFTVKLNPVVTEGLPYVHHTWIFGDGTPASNLVSPTHSFALPGTYAIVHNMTRVNANGGQICSQTFTKIVTITPDCNLVVDFSWTSVASNPLTIAFHNLSVPLSPTDSITWQFGDNTISHDVNPVHTYANAGTYNVCLIVKKFPYTTSAPCIRYICKTVVVQAPCNLVVDFSWHPTSTNPLTIEFTNLTTPLAVTDSITWTFGDGSTSHAVNPVHTYNVAGTYTVCLKVMRMTNSGTPICIRDICKTVVVQQPCNLVVDFSWNFAATNPLTVQFHNLSVPLSPTDSITWQFGDNSISHDVNPIHTYANAGTYTVCLIVKKYPYTTSAPCIRYICKTVVVPVPCNLVVDFSWHPTSTNLLTIEFTNLTTPLLATDSIRWTFGDGSTSSAVNPVHTYTAPGTYTVCLRVQRNNAPGTTPCVREICKTIVVSQPCNIAVNFSSQPDPAHPLRIKFTNLTNPALPSDSVRWTFGDGTSVSGLQSDPNVANPTHDYAQAGNYTVCLRVKRNINTTPVPCVGEKCQTIVVQQPCNAQVNFSWHLDSLNPRKVYFTNLTVSPTAAAIATWYFGDGTTATSWNAVHEYAQPGRYYVCLKIQFSNTCIKYKCDSVTVPVPLPPCNNQSNFSVLSTSTNSQTFTFVPAFQNNTAIYTWTFGDGTGSHDMIATHHYAQPGTYTACLTVWRSATCASTTCKTVVVQQQINCDSAHVAFYYQPDPQVPNKIHFYATTNIPILDQTWTITRLPVAAGTSPVTLHQNNPTYLFQDTGYYRVCLRAVTLGGCIKEYCSVIHITQVANACVLQAYPNPASSLVNVNVVLTQPEMINAYVYNSLNVLVREKHQQGVTGNNIVSISVYDLPAGMYTIKLIYGNHICHATFQKL